MQERQRVERIIAAAQETKAEQIVLYDMENRSAITDYVLICSGRSQAHVRGIAARIEEVLKKAGIRSLSIEGYQEGSWVLLDYDVVIVHIFHPETRQYYDLDGLFSGYPVERLGTHAPLRHGSPEDAAASA
ncbi:MAG: ribosome silencing factor [Candidatus Lambdaproteobacteria bacterium]|nr:ribosome silencing factor [Candidatus Lambdaproteobacteria bacterium]